MACGEFGEGKDVRNKKIEKKIEMYFKNFSKKRNLKLLLQQDLHMNILIL